MSSELDATELRLDVADCTHGVVPDRLDFSGRSVLLI
jgi:hypothetical protein